MASIDELRQLDDASATAEGSRTRFAIALAAALAVGLAALLLLAQLASQREPQGTTARDFLTRTMGAPRASASLVRKPAPNVRLSVGRTVRFERDDATVGVKLFGSSGDWTRHLRGASRPTSFGREAVVFRGEFGLEQYLRVDERQGTRTWRWQLDAPELTPVLDPNGAVSFFRGTRSAGIAIAPVAIFDLARRNVTPRGARWSLKQNGDKWTLALQLDDADLPLPYVVDPNIARTASNVANSGGNATSLAITRPGNVGDILIAQISVRNNDAVSAPAGWSLIDAEPSGTGLQESVFWATNSATLGTTFSWTNSNHAAGVISAYSDVHPTSPIDVSSANAGTGTTATATGVTTNFANSMLVALYSASGNVTITQTGSQGVTQFATTASTANPAGNRVRVRASDGLQASAGASGNKTATVSASAAWAAHLVALRREPPDGLGTISSDRSDVAASSTGNTIVWTYTAPADGLAAGEVRLTVPASWSAPSSTGSAAGYTTASAGTLSFAGQTIIVSNLTLAASTTMTITYGSTASSGPGATASATTGAVTWTTQQKGTSGGTLTNLASQPSITQDAPNGSGTMTASRSNVAASSTGNTITFTYTAATGGMVDGSVSIDVPASWSAPSTTGSANGYSTSTAGTLAAAGQTITVSGLTLAAGNTVDIVYGSTAGGGSGATASSTTGAVTWQAKQRSVNVGTLANLATSPSITQNAPDGSGTMSASPSNVAASSTGNTITFTYTAATGGMVNGSVSIDVPASWSAPSTTGSANGYSTSTAGTLAVAGQTITVSGLTLAGGATFDIVYGSTASGGAGATASSTTGAVTWQANQRSLNLGTLVALATSPSITQNAPNGSGTMSASPTTVGYATAGNTITFTYTAAAGGMSSGSISVDVPASWSAPSTTGTAAGYSTATAGTVSVAGQTITVSGLTLTGGGTVDVVYGSTAGAGPGATAPASAGAQTWQAKQRSLSSGTLANLGSSPSITVAPRPTTPSGLATTPGSPANDAAPEVTGTAPAGSTVELYTTTDCSGGVAASGSAALFGGAGITVSVTDNATTNLSATATDTYGGVSACSTSIAYTADSNPPSAPTISGSSPASPSNDNDPELTGSAEAGSTVKLFTTSDCSGVPVATGTQATFAGSGFSVNVSANSSTTFKATATDAAGNASSCSAGLDYVEDSTAPSSSFSSPSAGATYGSAGWSNPAGSASDAGGAALDRVEVSIRRDSTGLYWDGSGFSDGSENWRTAAGTGSWSLSFPFSNFPADGDYTVRLRAADTAGNVESASSRGFTVDATPPNTTITSQPADPTNATNPSFSFTSSEGGSTFECRLDGGAWSACTSPKSYTGVAQGPYTFDVRATDAPGNTDASPASYTWTIDTTEPTSTLSFPAATAYRNSAWNDFSGTASDTGGAGLDRVELSIRRTSTGLYWDGSGFNDGSENWRVATGTAAWSLSFAAGNFPADGDYVVRVRAADDATNVESSPVGRTFTIDNVAPQTTVDSGPSDPTSATGANVAFSSTETGSTFECRLDGGAWSACTSPKNYSGLTQGSHTFDVRATDVAGNTDGSPASFTWTIDTTAPSSAVTFPIAGGSYTVAGWNDIDGTASDTGGAALDQVEVSIRRVSSGLYWNGTAFADGSENWRPATGAASWSLSFAAGNFPADGDYVLRVRAVDTAGNVESPSSRTFTVDTVPPETTIDSAPANPVSSAAADFTFSADQTGSTFRCRLDGGTLAACTSPKSYAGLAEGSHTFEVVATDPGGNADPTPPTHTWVVDTVPPVVTMDDPGQYLRGTINLSSNATDTGGTGVASVSFQRSPAGAGTWSATPATWDTTSVANGLYDLRAVATDNAGNTSSSAPITGRWVDNLKPTVSVVDPGIGVTGTVTISANANDAHSGVEEVEIQFLDGSTWTTIGTDGGAPFEASWDTTGLADGPYDLRAIATDFAGNAETSATISTIVDNTDPTVSFTAPLDLGYVNATAADPFQLVADAADTGSGVKEVEFYECNAGGLACTTSTSLGVDAGALYQGSWTLPATDGVKHLKAIARDNAGREASVIVEVTLDRVEPDTTLASNPGNPSRDNTPDFTFSSNESPGTFECAIDGGAWTPCPSPYTGGPLADGPHTFDVRAIDAAGNVDPSPESWAWLLDTTPPTASIDDPGANIRGIVNLTSVQSDPGANPSGIASVEYQYSVADANTWVATPAAWDTLAVADGLYDVRVVVTDNAGNVTESAPVEDRRVDNSPPASAIDDPGANLRATVQLKATASDTGSGVADVTFQISPDGASWSTIGIDNSDPYEISFDTTTYPDGLYFFRTTATDVAGNQADGAAVGPRRIDNTLPTATLNDPGPNLRGTVNLSSVTDDPPGPPVASGVSSVVYEALIGGTWTGISQTWPTTTVPDGVYDLRINVTDVAGNQAYSNVVGGRRVDNTPPTTGHNAPSGWQSGGVTVSLSPSDSGSGISNTTYSVDGNSPQSGTSVSVSGDGIHTISFFSTDVAGNIESPQTATVMIDSTPPDPGAMDPGNYLRGTITLTANPSGGGGGGAEVTEVEFQKSPAGAGNWSSLGVDQTSTENPPYTAMWATTPADDGSYDLRFIVRDEAGNENITDLASKIVDNTAPTGTMSSPLAGSTVSGTVTLGVSANDANPIASVEYFVGGSSAGSSGSAPFQVGWNSAGGGDGPASIHAVITDMAGNSHTTGAVGITVDNFPPTVSLGGLPANVNGSVGVSAGASGDTVQVVFERRPAGGGGWTTIGTDTAAPWDATFDTTAVGDGNYELRAIATDAGANSGISGIVSTRVDNTAPSGMLTRPGDGQRVGGSAVVLEANASDSGSGVGSVTWEARQSGVGSFAAIAGDSGAPFAATWDVTALPSVAFDLRIVVTDGAGNTFTGPSITVDVDSTPPTVTLNNPGSPISGIVALSASTTGDATAVTFSRSPAGAASWTTIAGDGSPPYATNFDTTTVGDALYDLRAVVTDAVGNTSESIVGGIRIDNFVPIIVSSVPANGSIVATAGQIEITSTEDIAALTGVTLDGAPAPAPTISGTTATFNTGPLSPGAHTLSGTVRDGAGNSSAFSITFMVGVPAPPANDGGGDFADVLPLVPTPTNFRGIIETDGSLTLRWTPSRDGQGKPFATVLYIDDFATQSLAPGQDEVNLGPFDPADMRRFAIAAADTDGNASATTAQLRSSSLLAGKTLDEATAVLVNRGFELGEVRGAGPVVVAPQTAVMAALGSKVGVELGEPGTPQARLVFDAVGTKKYTPGRANRIALRLKTTRPAQVTAALLSPKGQRVYRWRFSIKAGTSIKRLLMPPQVRTPGKYRLVLTAQSGRESVKKTITLRIATRTVKPTTPIEVVLAGGSAIRNDIAAGLGNRMKVTAAVEEETWTFTGSSSRNVQVVVVDVDRFGLQLVRDLRTVFPSVKIIALTNDPRRLAQAVRSGATIAVPRSTPPRDLAKLIARLARRP